VSFPHGVGVGGLAWESDRTAGWASELMAALFSVPLSRVCLYVVVGALPEKQVQQFIDSVQDK